MRHQDDSPTGSTGRYSNSGTSATGRQRRPASRGTPGTAAVHAAAAAAAATPANEREQCDPPEAGAFRRVDAGGDRLAGTGFGRIVSHGHARGHRAGRAARPGRGRCGPLGYVDGMSLYEYVSSAPTEAVDALGLWTWHLDAEGKVIATCEEGDTLADLEREGYVGVTDAPDTWIGRPPEPGAVDVTRWLPPWVSEVLREQQAIPWSEIGRATDQERDSAGLPPVPPDSTVGTSGIDLTGPRSVPGTYRFGWGNCYGFVGQWLGASPPQGVARRNFSMTFLNGEAAGEQTAEAGTSFGPDELPGGPMAQLVPQEGLENFLTRGGRIDRPVLGDVAVFRKEGKIRHAAIVLGRSRAGDVYVIQKINQGSPYSVSKTTHPGVQMFGEAEFYADP